MSKDEHANPLLSPALPRDSCLEHSLREAVCNEINADPQLRTIWLTRKPPHWKLLVFKLFRVTPVLAIPFLATTLSLMLLGMGELAEEQGGVGQGRGVAAAMALHASALSALLMIIAGSHDRAYFRLETIYVFAHYPWSDDELRRIKRQDNTWYSAFLAISIAVPFFTIAWQHDFSASRGYSR